MQPFVAKTNKKLITVHIDHAIPVTDVSLRGPEQVIQAYA